MSEVVDLSTVILPVLQTAVNWCHELIYFTPVLTCNNPSHLMRVSDTKRQAPLVGPQATHSRELAGHERR